ncbi:MAG TPA: hypothetical protein VF297_17055 [Pyrinomonadaceae bacterium]
MHTTIRRLSPRSGIKRLLLCLLSLAATGQTVSPTFTLTGDLLAFSLDGN